jgi:drug/metabolite transporter (DMT)-like permease
MWLVIGGIGLTVNYSCFIAALEFTSAGAGGLVVQIQFVALALLAALVLKERIGIIKAAGIASVIGGVLVVFGLTGALSEAVKAEYALGNGIMLAAGLGWGTYALSNKALSKRMGNLEILIPIFVVAIVVTAPFSIVRFETKAAISPQAVMVIAVLGIGSTGAGFLLMSEGLRRLSGALVGTVTASTPLFTLLLANAILGEDLSPWMFLSAALIIAGVGSIVYSEWTERRGGQRGA